MNLIEIYINQVIKNLPAAEREEVKKDLNADILNMLPDDYTEDDIKKVLSQLGDPEILADEYRDAKRYLIGPKLYDGYLKLLRIVLPIVAVIGAVIFILESVFDSGSINFVDLFAGSLANLVNAAFTAFAAITIIFAVFERNNVASPFKKKQWTVDDLKTADVSTKPISKGEGIVSIIFSIIFFMILYFSPQLIGWYYTDNGIVMNIPLFNLDVLSRIMPLIILSLLFAVITSTLKIISGYWNIKLAFVNFLNNMFSAIVWIMIFANQNIFNASIFEKLSSVLDISTIRITGLFGIGIKVLIAFIMIGLVADSVSGFRKSVRK
ncbi:MAG: hypothetical protein AAGU14_00665 [Eubacteriaceae bacterium]